ncbi:PAS domain S-box protein [Syntrophobacter fumaroxidans]|uniref:histidine kinase n=1 Tax=Syntrophobacter fumaroxidans (strain DSM 10017 / MPOB) TaxID=335543 RepID=A0LEZ3_SYNFM|nr:PAS domain S-box protein [Syntrophobacter fumaroxidans]ABK15995.1 multi-sensor signal transduction histidine kinase [Syntrophobacter fumaroxidans MPOB]
MLDSGIVLSAFCLYMACLFLIALWVERKSAAGRSPANNPFVYSLSLAVYCTAWTYYGSVGQAATSGFLFLPMYLGPTIAIMLWWSILRRLVHLRNSRRITSIADFISARYGRSQSVAAMVTLIALVGITPYVALQLKAIISTFEIITAADASSWIRADVGPLVVVLMVVFTIILGVRRLDPTERHEGMMMALAVECVIKLLALLTVGIFVTYFMYDGFGDIFRRFSESPFHHVFELGRHDAGSYVTWTGYLVLSMSAILFLPRQFHVAVVENHDEKHILTAMWLLPLYLLLVSMFVLPIAAGGLLDGRPPDQADTFVLRIPLQHGKPWLSLLVFIGGFSAAAGMIMITSVTMATMITNHLLLPLVQWIPGLAFVKRHLLKCRWGAVAGFIIIGYWFEERIGESYMLVNIGLISFAAGLQFAPAILGGLFWRGGNKTGAILGLAGGFAVWSYTLLLPSFIKSGWISNALLEKGAWGIELLKPEELFGLTGLNPLSHAVLWTMFVNIGLYVAGSLCSRERDEERSLAEEFVGVLGTPAPLRRARRWDAYIELAPKRSEIEKVFGQYFAEPEATAMVEKCLFQTGIHQAARISIVQLVELHNEVERSLAGAIGSAAAHKALQQGTIFTPREAQELSEVYGEILADLKVLPSELSERIDYYQERERLLLQQARELEEKVNELRKQIRKRKRAQAALRESEERYRTLVESTSDAILMVDKDRMIVSTNQAFLDLFGYERGELEGQSIRVVHPSEESYVVFGQRAHHAIRTGAPFRTEWNLVRKDGTILPMEGSYSAIRGPDGSPTAYVAVIRDITERKKAEEELKNYRDRLENMVRERTLQLEAAQKALVQREKLKTLGAIAAEVAHEIRNPLMSLGGFAMRLQKKYPESPEVEIILEESRRLEKILDRIKDYLRPVDIRSRECPVNTVAAECVGLLAQDLERERVVWQLDLAPELPPALVDPDVLGEVFVHVITHIAKVMDKQGLLTIRTYESDRNIQIDFRYRLPAHKSVQDPERLFLPFEEGDATGGVPLSYRLLKGMGGLLFVTQEERDTLFTVSLPRVPESSGDTKQSIDE